LLLKERKHICEKGILFFSKPIHEKAKQKSLFQSDFLPAVCFEESNPQMKLVMDVNQINEING
jgi:hypothetical protein